MSRKKVVVISGPTASGKTKLALSLAKKYKGYIINADSRTIYKGLDVGTAKPTKAEQKKVKHHLINVVKPDKRFTAVDFKRAAEKIIAKNNKLAFIVGGTGLYISALVENWHFGSESKGPTKYDSFILVLSPPRKTLYDKINKRVKTLWRRGLVAETKRLQKKYDFTKPAFTGIGYREVVQYLTGKLTKQQAIDKIQTQTRRYAKRQWTWWRGRKNVHWITTEKQATKLIAAHLKK